MTGVLPDHVFAPKQELAFGLQGSRTVLHPEEFDGPREYEGGFVLKLDVGLYRDLIYEGVMSLLDGANPEEVPVVQGFLELQKQFPVLVLDGMPVIPRDIEKGEVTHLDAEMYQSGEATENTLEFHGDDTRLPFLVNSSLTGRQRGTIYTTRTRSLRMYQERLFKMFVNVQGRVDYLPRDLASVFQNYILPLQELDVKALNDKTLLQLQNELFLPMSRAVRRYATVAGMESYWQWLIQCSSFVMRNSDWIPEDRLEVGTDSVCVHFPAPIQGRARWVISSNHLFHSVDQRVMDEKEEDLPPAFFMTNGWVQRLEGPRPRR